ncbi:hypothetical protein CEXT_245161 [Caerostris extrusa]|uniref:Uncharacterized protein n=1 Tax=Caerostris extrusa TaxID=172846 RepID=A0AAV4XJA2_CAEEX|nr:hypothetical protein CEXT_245161 [Caerostris extrusa]
MWNPIPLASWINRSILTSSAFPVVDQFSVFTACHEMEDQYQAMLLVEELILFLVAIISLFPNGGYFALGRAQSDRGVVVSTLARRHHGGGKGDHTLERTSQRVLLRAVRLYISPSLRPFSPSPSILHHLPSSSSFYPSSLLLLPSSSNPKNGLPSLLIYHTCLNINSTRLVAQWQKLAAGEH